MDESCHTCKWPTAHTGTRHVRVTHVDASWHTCECPGSLKFAIHELLCEWSHATHNPRRHVNTHVWYPRVWTRLAKNAAKNKTIWLRTTQPARQRPSPSLRQSSDGSVFFLAGDYICTYILKTLARTGLFTPVSLGYPLSVFNKNSTLNLTETTEPARQSECLINEVKRVVFLGGRSHLLKYTSLWLEGTDQVILVVFWRLPKKKRYTRRFWGTPLLFWRLSRSKSSFLQGSQATGLFLSLAGDHIYTYTMTWRDWPTSILQKARGLYIYSHMYI